MGINTSKAAAKAEVAAPAAEQTMVLQLARLTRLVYVNGGIYENHKAYRFGMAEAQRKLSEADMQTGLPVWKVYRAPAQREVDSTPEAPLVVDAAAAPTVNDKPASVTGVNGIEIGTAEELAELGLPPLDDENVVQV